MNDEDYHKMADKIRIEIEALSQKIRVLRSEKKQLIENLNNINSIPFARKVVYHTTLERNIQIFELRAKGLTQKEISIALEMTQWRVQQILKRGTP